MGWIICIPDLWFTTLKGFWSQAVVQYWCCNEKIQTQIKKNCQTLQKCNRINSNEVLTIYTFKTVFADCDFLC